LINKVRELYKVRDWRGLVALEATAIAAAAQLRETRPIFAVAIYSMLGTGCTELRQYAKAIGLSEKGLAIAEEVGDWAGKGGRVPSLDAATGISASMPRQSSCMSRAWRLQWMWAIGRTRGRRSTILGAATEG